MAWSVIGLTAVTASGMIEDIAQPVAAAIAMTLTLIRRHQRVHAQHAERSQLSRTTA